jgi:SAM-dependent methyltransferase
MNLEVANKVWGEEWTLDINFINDTIHQLDLTKNSKVLDIGTGAGIMTMSLALNEFEVLTGEPDKEYEDYEEHEGHEGCEYPDWREAVKVFGVEHKIIYQYFNAERLPFSTESFDGVFLYDTLHHIINKEKALSECLRVVKPKKVVCIIEMNANGNTYSREKYGFTDGRVVDPRDIIKGDDIVFEFIPGEFSNAYLLRNKG